MPRRCLRAQQQSPDADQPLRRSSASGAQITLRAMGGAPGQMGGRQWWRRRSRRGGAGGGRTSTYSSSVDGGRLQHEPRPLDRCQKTAQLVRDGPCGVRVGDDFVLEAQAWRHSRRMRHQGRSHRSSTAPQPANDAGRRSALSSQARCDGAGRRPDLADRTDVPCRGCVGRQLGRLLAEAPPVENICEHVDGEGHTKHSVSNAWG